MGEIIQLNIGGCGSLLGGKFTECLISSPQNISPDIPNNTQSNTYFNSKDELYARSIFIDYNPEAIFSSLRNTPPDLIKSENCIYSEVAIGSNRVRGHFREAGELLHSALSAIHKESEKCDNLQGFQINHCIGGNAGSFMTSELINSLRDSFPELLISTFTVFSDPEKSMIEPYNTVLGLHQLIENSDINYVIDNASSAKFSDCTNYTEFNSKITETMIGVTSSLRHPEQVNSSLPETLENMIPFPRLHFLNIGHHNFQSFEPQQIVEIYKDTLFNFDPIHCLALSVLFEGEIPPETVSSFKDHTCQKLNNFQSVKTSTYLESPSNSCSMVGNFPEIHNFFGSWVDAFRALYRTKTYLHWYTGEGICEVEFEESVSNVEELISEYSEQID